MDLILIIKAFSIGCLGAIGFYFVISFMFQYFPLPMLLKTRTLLLTWASKKYKKDGDLADKVWTIGNNSLVVIILVIWWLIFGLFAYLLYNMLAYYIPVTGNSFWIYYGIAIVVPSLWALIQFFSFFKQKKEKEEDIDVDTNKTLIEQITG
jgi:uncharacterized membrane protein YuzA (DUF378 family)